jgi:hypothetical protein
MLDPSLGLPVITVWLFVFGSRSGYACEVETVIFVQTPTPVAKTIAQYAPLDLHHLVI